MKYYNSLLDRLYDGICCGWGNQKLKIEERQTKQWS